mgnify:FL=1
MAIFKKYELTGTTQWTAAIAARDLSYQIGSLTKVLMQIDGQRYAEGKDSEELKAKVADELADILAEVLFIAHEMDISMEDAWQKMLGSDNNKISQRSSQ